MSEAGQRGPGMDHDLYPYSPFPERPPLSWPGGARLALWVVLHVDWWELTKAPGTVRPPGLQGPWGNFEPDWRTFTYREYGHRVGLSRILAALDRFGLRATVALGSEAARRYPAIVRECAERGYEFAAHGTHATRVISSRMSEDEERRFIAESLDGVEAACGTRPIGWIGQDFGESWRTPALLHAAGLTYLCDWPNDDQPYRMESGLLSLPYQSEWDDVQALWLRQIPTWDYPGMIADAADALWSEGGRMLGINIHPWLFGQAARIKYLEEALTGLAARESIWRATGAEIARHVMSG